MESKTKNLSVKKPEIGDPSWFKHWFDSSFYHQLYGERNEQEASFFIDNILAELQPLPGSRMLDLGCGAGRHAKYLASRGFYVTGLDLAASSIRTAKKFESSHLFFARRDMRIPFGLNLYDYVFNFFTSFGYFGSLAENNKVVANISASLKPGAWLLIDYLNSSYAETRLVAAERKEIDGIIYSITRSTDEQNFYKKISIENMGPGGSHDYVEQVAKLSIEDFDMMFKRNGLHLQNVFGNYNLDSYDQHTSPRMILLARKK